MLRALSIARCFRAADEPHHVVHFRGTMYRILIIDDEPVVREGIAENIDWRSHGYELAGTCKDGREAMQAIEEEQPDVILTDICMPFVDGMELASFVADRYPAIKTILLTGFDEFEYAQEAVRLRVHSFLLKPITPRELLAELDALRMSLDVERNRTEQLERLRSQIKESLPVLRERLMNRILHAEIAPADIPRRLSILDISLDGGAFAALVCDPDSLDSEQELAEIAVQSIAEEVVAEFPAAVAFATPRVRTVAVVAAPSDAEAASMTLSCAERISERVTSELGFTVSIGMGEPVEVLDRLGESYDQARVALDRRIVLGPHQIIAIEQVRGQAARAHSTAEARELRNRYTAALKTGNASAAAEALMALVTAFASQELPLDEFRTQIMRLIAELMAALESIGMRLEDVPAVDAHPLERLAHVKTQADVREWLLELTESITRHLAATRDEHSHVKAVEAEEYIRGNFADRSLSLARLCAELAVSKSYFSPLFKAHTGMTFVEFLTTVRMDRARELLANSDMKTYEVARLVGFADPHYFSLTFKKQTGVTPTEYRSEIRTAS